VSISDGFKILDLILLDGGDGWDGPYGSPYGSPPNGGLVAHCKDGSFGTGFVGTWTHTDGVITSIAVTNPGKNYSSGSWPGGLSGSASDPQYNAFNLGLGGRALAGEYTTIGVLGPGSGSIIIPKIGQDSSISFADIAAERGYANSNLSIGGLYAEFGTVTPSKRPNADWWQGGVTDGTYQQSIPIRIDEFYGATYDTYGGVGCLSIGTLITMSDGSTKKVEDVDIGDWVLSCNVPTMPLDFDDEDTWIKWVGNPKKIQDKRPLKTRMNNPIPTRYEIQDLSGQTSASVMEIYFDYYEDYYKINGTLDVTYEHPFFIYRNDKYTFIKTRDILIGDKLLKDNGDFEVVDSVEHIEDVLETVNFNVEPLDVYYGGGYLMHNVNFK